jgi:hypothetical protein
MKQTSLAVALVAASTASAITLTTQPTETTPEVSVAFLLDNIVIDDAEEIA